MKVRIFSVQGTRKAGGERGIVVTTAVYTVDGRPHFSRVPRGDIQKRERSKQVNVSASGGSVRQSVELF